MSGARTLLSIGDPNGIGPEIAVAAARSWIGDPAAAPVLVGDRAVVETAIDSTRARLTVRDHVPGTVGGGDLVDLLDVGALPAGAHRPGEISAAAGAATIAYVTAAVREAQRGGYRAVVACPHSETAVHAAGIAFRGYPPLVAQLTGAPPERVFLLLAGGGLRIVHATLHERLADALGRLTPELVADAARVLHEALGGTDTARIGVFGINPHAGEGGLFGADDERVTIPAVATLRAEGLPVDGPVGADVLLGGGEHAGYVAIYHDQGHIPVKLLAGRSAVAMTVGAGVPFCSVGHGTAFDIAGTGRADPTAVVRALHVLDPTQPEQVPEAAPR
ncbi:4-hydroxythreonine-4-phosphate dehydrogenase PdxA [Pseudonocardia sp. KRD-291]|nr:4-hydroxythreonine-4-phosphate dehydrogenase PdxA [Pseudonocardia sp. KRD291]